MTQQTYIKSRKHGAAAPAPKAGLVAATAIAVLGMPALAQNAPAPAPTVTLKEVTVEAPRETGYEPSQLSSPKFTQPLVNTTQTISVVKEQVMKEQGATTLTEALRNVPGVGTFYEARTAIPARAMPSTCVVLTRPAASMWTVCAM